MKRIPLVFVVAGLGACGGGNRPVDPTTAHAGPSACEKMADHLVSLMKTGAAADAPQDASDRITRVIIERCTEDGWSIDAQQCFLGVETLEQSDGCAPLLTVTQRDAADRAMKDAFPDAARKVDGEPTAPPPEPDPQPLEPTGQPAVVPPPPVLDRQLDDAKPRPKAKKKPAPKPMKKDRKTNDSSLTGDPCDGGE